MGDLSEIFEAWTNRIRSPLFGYFSLSFAALNWREILYLLVSDSEIQERIEYFDLHTCADSLFWHPLGISVVAALAYPWVQYVFIWATSSPNTRRNIVNARAESKLLIEKLRLEDLRNELRIKMEQAAIDRAKTDENVEGIKDNDARKRARDEVRAIRESTRHSHQDITKTTLKEYLSAQYPDKPQDDKLLSILLRDLSKEKYQKIGDISMALSEAAPFLKEYSARNPKIFSSSTDYLTKALGFVDPQFRKSHGFSEETLNAFREFERG